MKSTLVTYLQKTLEFLCQKTLAKFEPVVIGVTGSVGKTSTKRAITTVLSDRKHIRASYANLNTELGVCLTILGDWTTQELELVSRKQQAGTKTILKAWFWLKVIVLGSARLLFLSREKYPEVLIIEYGADRPGDIKRLLKIVRPDIAVISAIGAVPVHVEFYSGPDEVAREKAKLIEALPASGFAILNADDPIVMGIKDRTRARLLTYGFDENANLKISGFEYKVIDDIPVGISFKLEQNGSFVPVRMQNIYGKSHAYAAAAAASVAQAMGMNLVSISQNLENYKPAEGRMNLLPGLKNSLILDDSYNASPESMRAAIEVLASLPATRRIAVLGDMLEIGKYALQAHEAVAGQLAGKIDVLVTVGLRGKLIADAMFQSKTISRKNIYSFGSAEEAQNVVFGLLQEGDLVLVKASRGIGLDAVVKAICSFE